MKLSVRLILGFVVVATFSLIVGSIGIVKLHRIDLMVAELYSENLRPLYDVGNAKSHFLNIARLDLLYISADPAKRKEILVLHKAELDELNEHLETYEKTKLGDTELKHLNNFREVKNGYLELSQRAHTLSDAGRTAEANKLLLEEGKQYFEKVEESAEALIETTSSLASQTVKEADEVYQTSRNGMIAIISFSFLVSVLIGWWLSRSIGGRLGKVASDLFQNAESMKTGSLQLSTASQQVSSGSTEAAASLEETVASLEELNSMVKLNSENAKQAAQISIEATQSATNGEKEIKHLIESMTEVSKSSKKIEEIINVIDDIAFQTNLLALNAAVEAARAGEQGKGFAVVADAVRSLAQRSSTAAKDITGLIKESVSQIETASKLADGGGAALTEITINVRKVADLNNEIATASSEQTLGLQQISKAMNELDSATQQNAAASEEVAATSEQMMSQSENLARSTDQLIEVIEGNGAAKRNQGEAPSGKVFPMTPSKAKTKAAHSESNHSETVEKTGTEGF